MKPAPFTYLKPSTVGEALEMLASHGQDVKLLAGGQSLTPMLNLRLARPEVLIDINGLTELAYCKIESGMLCNGALARHADIADSAEVATHFPLISNAYKHVAHRTIRNRGTLCGNLSHADPASEMPAVMLALNAEMCLRSKGGERIVKAADFFEGIYSTALRADEMLTEVRVPLPETKFGYGFEEVSVRQGDYAMALAASALKLDNGKISAAALSFAGVADKALRFEALEKKLIGQSPDDKLFSEIADEAVDLIFTPDESDSDRIYREELIRTLTQRVLKQAVTALAV